VRVFRVLQPTRIEKPVLFAAVKTQTPLRGQCVSARKPLRLPDGQAVTAHAPRMFDTLLDPALAAEGYRSSRWRRFPCDVSTSSSRQRTKIIVHPRPAAEQIAYVPSENAADFSARPRIHRGFSPAITLAGKVLQHLDCLRRRADYLPLSYATPLAQEPPCQLSEQHPTLQIERAATGRTAVKCRQMPQDAQRQHFESQYDTVNLQISFQLEQCRICRIIQLGIRISFMGQVTEEFRDVIPCVESREVAGRRSKATFQPGFSQQIERFG